MFWEKTLSFVYLTSVYFSAVISVITTTVFKRALFPLLIDPHGTSSSPSPSEASEGDAPLSEQEQTQMTPLPCLHPDTALLQRARRSNIDCLVVWEGLSLTRGLVEFCSQTRRAEPKCTPVTPQKHTRELEQRRSPEGTAHGCQKTWEEQSWFLSTKCLSRKIWTDRSSSQLKVDADTTIITRKDISHLLFLFFKKGWVFWLLFPCLR